jgi:hypothetical protein
MMMICSYKQNTNLVAWTADMLGLAGAPSAENRRRQQGAAVDRQQLDGDRMEAAAVEPHHLLAAKDYSTNWTPPTAHDVQRSHLSKLDQLIAGKRRPAAKGVGEE